MKFDLDDIGQAALILAFVALCWLACFLVAVYGIAILDGVI